MQTGLTVQSDCEDCPAGSACAASTQGSARSAERASAKSARAAKFDRVAADRGPGTRPPASRASRCCEKVNCTLYSCTRLLQLLQVQKYEPDYYPRSGRAHGDAQGAS